MTEHGQAGGQSAHVAVSKGCSDGQTVRQVVDSVTEDDHPGHAGDVLRGGVGVRVGVAVAMVRNLKMGIRLLCKLTKNLFNYLML